MKTFKCPECGDYRFGTSNCLKPFSEWVGECHGYKNGQKCMFVWQRDTQDREVMHETETPKYSHSGNSFYYV
jgi:hypothetical protein